MQASETPTRPTLRYHGGKWILAPWIISHFPEHRTYTECYGGAASVLMRKSRSYAEVYNEIDGEVVNLFRVLRDPLSAFELTEALRLTPFAREEYQLSRTECSDDVERARRLTVRSFMGFGSAASRIGYNTGFRANSNRSGTTPAHDWVNYPECLALMTKRLRGVVIECRSALEVLAHHDGPETLHYVDPPYVHVTRANNQGSCQIYSEEMTDEQHCELAAALMELSGMIVLSGYPCDLYDGLYRNWHRIERKSFADGARERTEVLWINPACANRQRNLFSE